MDEFGESHRRDSLHSPVSMEKKTDALVVGAGPTGLTLGCELLRRGLKVRLIEKLAEPTDQSRALALQSRTLEVLERMGILDRFLKQGKIIRRGNFHHNGKLFGILDFSQVKAPYPFILSIAQSETEQILARHFEDVGGKVERGISLQSLQGSEATLQYSDGHMETTAATWIFGCDGAHSEVRHSLRLPFTGAAFPETFALADVEMFIDLPADEGHFFSYKSGLCGLVPLSQKNHFRIIALLPKQMAKKETVPDLPFFRQFVPLCSGVPVEIKTASWISLFTVHRRIVSKMRVGNVFLLGDAAHIHSPAGGQGLNTSVQDAFNLGWKVALVHDKRGQEQLLDTFEEERLPVAKNVLQFTTRLTNIMASRFLKTLVLPIVSLLLKRPFFKKQLALSISELNVGYRPSSIIDKDPDGRWKGPRCGERAPDANLGNKRLFQLYFHPLHTLLCFGGKEFVPFIDAIQHRYSAVIRFERIPSEQGGEAVQVYQALASCFYFIRPDGLIAYRSLSLDSAPFLRFLTKIFKI